MAFLQAPVEISPIAHVIQQAVAPAFVLTATGGLLGVQTNRLARIIDRARAMEGQHDSSDDAQQRAGLREQLAVLSTRARHVNRAIAATTGCAILIACVIATLFVGAVAHLPSGLVVAALFVTAMGLLILGQLHFLREVFLATRTIRIGRTEHA
jgi:hypothetical protein